MVDVCDLRRVCYVSDCTVFVIEGSVLCCGCPWDMWGFDCVVYVWYDISCTREQQPSFIYFVICTLFGDFR